MNRRAFLWSSTSLLALAACGEEIGFVPVHAAGAEVHRVPTEDGAEVVLSRYRRNGGEPVVLCHGISSNHHFWDLEPGRSLALYLHKQGYDVWNMDLRGHGLARRDSEGRRQRSGWTIDDYGQYDLPAALAHVRHQTRVSHAHYVGHSMGGMVLAVYLARADNTGLASAVLVGSPLDFRDADSSTSLFLSSASVARSVPSLPTPLGSQVLASLGVGNPLHLADYLYNPANVEHRVQRLLLRRVVSPLTRGELRQLHQARHGEFLSADGQRVYRKQLGHIKVPMMFFAGRVDHIAQPDQVRSYYDAVGSPDKEFVIASAANGFLADYGHLDLGLGDVAEKDVFPRIGAWLQRWSMG